ncbi:MAG: response regulator, partial [Bacteroidota bacterium]|nr:response regulator [Bacteroidota bacterium]
PTQVIGYLSEPLLMPNDAEREGYVPNVVYSCGAIIHNNELIIPYAMADYSSGFASVDVNELFEKMLPAKMKEAPKAATIKPGYRILFVRDERNDQTNLAQLLIQEGYYVEVASDGVMALMEINKKTFDLIVSDMEMPNLTQFQLLEFLSERKLKTPVVFLSNSISKIPEINGLKTGAVEYIKKPVDFDNFLLRLKFLLQNK